MAPLLDNMPLLVPIMSLAFPFPGHHPIKPAGGGKQPSATADAGNNNNKPANASPTETKTHAGFIKGLFTCLNCGLITQTQCPSPFKKILRPLQVFPAGFFAGTFFPSNSLHPLIFFMAHELQHLRPWRENAMLLNCYRESAWMSRRRFVLPE